MNTPNTLIVVSKNHFPLEETRLLEEIFDSRCGIGNVQDEPKVPVPENKKVIKN